MNRTRSILLTILIGYLIGTTGIQAQSVIISGSCFSSPVTLTENTAGTASTGRIYYEGIGTINGTPNITIAVAWHSSFNSWFVRLNGGAHFYYQGNTPLPPNNNHYNWVKINEGGNLTYCPNGTPISITGDGTQHDPLPVTLVAFYSQTTAGRIMLNWTTTEEQNNAGFELMRSPDAQIWTSVGFVDGKGSTSSLQEYNLEDPEPLPGINYYRLTQIDLDGKGTYSRIIAASYEATDNGYCYPNPTDNSLQVNLPNGQIIKQINIISRFGKKLRSLEGPANQVEVGELPAGQYMLEVTTRTGLQIVESFIKR
ncbi:T9SS type A sorting domain-containing protein [Dyadobacter tibetensis]|uniref:T9SS type A sorting domain-containing protein n=1 Tax=Dyadobacter tibetensis TaxID=1211851 RepID=UPI000470F1F6|nr:T9SS type A sorting domain-containing protein [Dyadobacter tibetensis]